VRCRSQRRDDRRRKRERETKRKEKNTRQQCGNGMRGESPKSGGGRNSFSGVGESRDFG
jgi:hypothetical protein